MAAKKKGLGRGLDLLIPEGNNTKQSKTEKESKPIIKEVVKEVVKEVKVPAETFLKLSDIEPNREQPRKNFDKEALEELADSIKQYGLIQPIVVQKKDDYYEIIAGERRWRAAKMAKLKEVPVIIKEYSPQEVMEIALIENIQRRDLNPIEEALAYKSLIDEYNLKQEEVADRVSKSRTAVTNSMRLLKLAEQVQTMLINEELSMGHARALLSIEKEEVQVETAKAIVERKLSVRETEKLVKKMQNTKQNKEKDESWREKDQLVYDQAEENLKIIFGTKVAIHRKNSDQGQIQIDYYSFEDLDRILDFINEQNRMKIK